MLALSPLLALFAIRLAPGIAFQSAAVAMPVMVGALGIDHAQAGLVLGAFTLPGIAVTVPAGLLAARFGDRAVLRLGLSVVALGALLAFLAPSLPLLIAARAIGGAGGAAVLMLIIKMTADRYAGPWLATASAVAITSWPAGLALGLLLLGPVPDRLGWHSALALAGVPALLALALVSFVGEGGRPVRAHPAPGAFGSPPLRFVVGAVMCWSLINAVFVLIVGFLPGYLASVGRTLQSASAVASLAAWSPALAIPLAGVFADRLIGRPAAVLMGLVGTALMLSLVVDGYTNPLAMVALGAMFAAAPGPLTAQLGQAVPPQARAVVFGCYSAGSYCGMTLAPWLAGWARDATGQPAAPLLLAAALSLAAIAPYALVARGAAVPRTAPG